MAKIYLDTSDGAKNERGLIRGILKGIIVVEWMD